MCDVFEDDGLLSERLIHLVSGYPELYDRSNENHNNSEVKFEIWRAIAESLDIPCEAAMKRWKALRDAYNRSLREINLIKSGRKTKSKCTPYKFSTQMNFLNHHLKKRRKYFSKAYLQEKSASQQEEIESFVDDADEMNLNPGDTPKSYVIVHYSPDDEIPELEQGIRTHGLKRPRNYTDSGCPTTKFSRPGPKTDEDELWLLSLVPVLKRLSGYQRGVAKIKIQQLLLDIEYGDQPKQLDFTE